MYFNEEIDYCEVFKYLPTSESFPIQNLRNFPNVKHARIFINYIAIFNVIYQLS